MSKIISENGSRDIYSVHLALLLKPVSKSAVNTDLEPADLVCPSHDGLSLSVICPHKPPLLVVEYSKTLCFLCLYFSDFIFFVLQTKKNNPSSCWNLPLGRERKPGQGGGLMTAIPPEATRPCWRRRDAHE